MTSSAREYLQEYLDQIDEYAPSVTVATLQRNTRPPGTKNWGPGVGSYGWGANGSRTTNSGGVVGLSIGVRMWYSDRRTNQSDTPTAWQQFSAESPDELLLTLTPDGDAVHCRVDLITWHSSYEALSLIYEPESRQLVFVVPGAGPNAPLALMIVTLHATGQFGFL